MTADARRWSALAVAYATLAISFSLSLFSLPVFYPALIARYKWSHAEAAAGGSIVLLMIGVLGPAVGWLAGRVTPRLVLLFGMAGGSIAMTLLSFVDSRAEYYAGCVVLGVATAAVSLVPASMLVAPWFPGRRGLIVGVINTGAGVGGFIAPLVVSALIRAHGVPDAWRWLAMLPALLWIATLALAPPAPAGATMQTAGSRVGYAAVLLTVGPVLFFAAHALIGVQQHLALYLTGQGVPADKAAFALSMILGGSIIGRLAGGVLADRFSARVSLIASIACLMVAIAGLLAIAPASPIIPGVAAVFGLGYGGVFNAPPIVAFEYVGADGVGRIMGALMLFFGLGTASGGFVAGWIFDRAHRYAPAFLADLGSCAVAIGILTVMGRVTASRVHR